MPCREAREQTGGPTLGENEGRQQGGPAAASALPGYLTKGFQVQAIYSRGYQPRSVGLLRAVSVLRALSITPARAAAGSHLLRGADCSQSPPLGLCLPFWLGQSPALSSVGPSFLEASLSSSPSATPPALSFPPDTLPSPSPCLLSALAGTFWFAVSPGCFTFTISHAIARGLREPHLPAHPSALR